MVWLATLKADVVNVARPEDSVTFASVFEPSAKITVPVGAPAPGAAAATVAVTVTAWPYTDGFGDEVTVMLDEALLMSCGLLESVPLLARKSASPP